MTLVMATKVTPGAPPPLLYDDNNQTMALQRFSSSSLPVHHQQPLPPQPIVFMPASFYYIYYKKPACYYYPLTTTATNTASNHDELQLQLQLQTQPKVLVRKNKRKPRRGGPLNNRRRDGATQGRYCCWVPKSTTPTAAAPHVFSLKFAGKTTVMIKNVPNQLTRKSFMTILDDICLKQNRIMSEENAEPSRAEPSRAVRTTFPIDFKTGCDRGYAVMVCATMYGRTWKSNPRIKKICKFQGKTEHVKHLKNVSYQSINPDYLPVLLHPPRDGSSTNPATISTTGILDGFGSMQYHS